MKIDLIVTSNSKHLAEILSENSDFHVHHIKKNKDGQRYFPDGEVYVNLDKLCERRVVVLYSGAPRANDGLVELELILSLLKERQINPVELFITYFAYSRQDSVFQDGELNVAETLIKRWVGFYGIKKIYVIDAHFEGKPWVSKYPVEHISATGLLKEAVFYKYPEVSFIAPDTGSAKRNNLRGFMKKRKNSYDMEISWSGDLEKNVKGKTIGVIDDMIETGGTMVGVFKKSKELGASKTIAIVTHGVLQSGIDKIKNTYDELFLTNTIPCNHANVDISSLIINSLSTRDLQKNNK